VAGTILHGPEYNVNNGIVFDLLQPLTMVWPLTNAPSIYREAS